MIKPILMSFILLTGTLVALMLLVSFYMRRKLGPTPIFRESAIVEAGSAGRIDLICQEDEGAIDREQPYREYPGKRVR